MKRRDFVGSAAAAGGWAVAPGVLRAAESATGPGKPLRILILGGTGFTGPFQVEYALKRGHKVTLFNRGKRPSPEWSNEVEQLHGDRNTGDLEALKGREWDVCIDNPTTLPFWVRDAADVLAGKVGHYLFISTISVYASTDKAGMDEAAPVATYAGKDAMAETLENLMADIGGLYGPLKALSEKEARHRYGEAHTTIIRPGYIVGPRDGSDRFTYWPHRIAEGGDVLVPGDGSDPVQVIDGRDLAEWVIRLAEGRVAGTFNATGPARELSTSRCVETMAKALQSDVRFRWVPWDKLESLGLQLGSDLPIFLPAAGEYAGFHRVSVQRAMGAGLTYRPLDDTVRDLMAWWKALPAERQAKTSVGMSRERESEALAQLAASQG
ncbi:MAG: epimerase [Xanthomonadales bacterium]|nr:epimerase [Xanthomonadales bacterium]